MEELVEDVEKDMTPKLIGETYLRKPTETSSQRYSYGLYECQYCGKEFETMVQSVKCGDTKSCGCISKETSTTHGLCHHRFYPTWHSMTYRCNNPKDKGYKHYGGRGIEICDRWNKKTQYYFDNLPVASVGSWRRKQYGIHIGGE